MCPGRGFAGRKALGHSTSPNPTPAWGLLLLNNELENRKTRMTQMSKVTSQKVEN